MRKFCFAMMLTAASFLSASAQKGNNAISIGFDVSNYTGDYNDAYKTGFGGSVKGLYGIGSAGQITLTSGYTFFKGKDMPEDYDATASIIPILAGYRHNLKGFYIEPQVGYGIYGMKMESPDGDFDDSEGAFTWAAGLGYTYKGFDLGARYQSAHKDGNSSGFIGVRLGYNISL